MTEYKTAADVLTEANRLVSGDRGKTHGGKHDNFTKIARIWNAYLRNANPAHIPLTPSQAADLMELMKVARRQSGTFNPDDYIDGAGYAGVAFEAHVEEDRLLDSVRAAKAYGAAAQPLGGDVYAEVNEVFFGDPPRR